MIRASARENAAEGAIFLNENIARSDQGVWGREKHRPHPEELAKQASRRMANVEKDDPEYTAYEGEQRRLYVLHRRRESSLRRKKIAAARIENAGVLKCEVPGCRFDFKVRYGELGEGFAHVHHKKPLAEMPREGQKVSLKELAVVCANCHAMIHVGGECRPLEDLIVTGF